MGTSFPQWGDFTQDLPHELVIYLLESEFTGKLELLFEDNITRTVHFIDGDICGVISSVATEQTEKIIETELSSELNDKELKEIDEKINEGKSYSQALVDAGIISSTDILAYANKQAELVITNSLATTPLEYKILDEKPKRVNPLEIDLATVIRKSIVNDLDSEMLSQKIGDESICYLMSEEFDNSSSNEKDEEELKALIPHLDGRRSVEEISSKIGLNPDRTRRLILFLKLMHWLEPAYGSSDDSMVESPETIMAPDESAAAKYEEPQPAVEESAEILELLDDDDTYEAETEPTDMPALDQEDIVQLSEQPEPSEKSEFIEESDQEKPDDSSFQEVLSTKSTSGKFRVVYTVILPIVFGIIAVGSITISILSNSSNSQKLAGADLSFYPETVDQQQLPLDKDFSKESEADPTAMRIEIGPPEPEQNEEVQSGNTPVLDISQDQSQTETSEKPPEPEQNEDIQTASQQNEEPEVQSQQTSSRPRQDRVVRSWDEAQRLALNEGVRGRWIEAAIIWSGPLSVLEKNTHTVLVSTAEQTGFISSVFERFANSPTLRGEFFVIQRSATGFFVCWGLFPDVNSAQQAMRSLPSRIQQFRPSVRLLSDLQGK